MLEWERMLSMVFIEFSRWDMHFWSADVRIRSMYSHNMIMLAWVTAVRERVRLCGKKD